MANKRTEPRKVHPAVPFVKHVAGEPRVGVCFMGRFYDPIGLVAGQRVTVAEAPLEWSSDEGATWRPLGPGREI